jgi:predicted chitinase
MEFSDTRFDIIRRFRPAPDCYLEIVISRLFPRSVCTRAGVTRRVARQARAVVLPLACVLLLVACVSGVTDSSESNAGGAAPGLGGSSAGGNTVFNNGGSTPISSGGTTNSAGGNPAAAGSGAGGSAAVVPCTFPNWVAKMPYVTGDKVLYNGAGYIATMDNPGYDPTISTFFWTPFPCQPVPGAGGSGGTGPTNSGGTGGGGPTNTDPNCPLNKLLANGSVSFDAMFQPPWAGHVAKPLYSYTALCQAIGTAGFSAFANSGDMTKDKHELAAFFAHVAKETAFLEQSDEAGEASNAQDYHGRGAIQITGQSNYAAAGQYLGKDLVGNPGLVSTDPLTNWQTALWFWMINYNPGTAGIQNCHQAILGGDFAQTTRIINGGIECPGSQSAQDRAQYFKNDCSALSVDPGSSLVC